MGDGCDNKHDLRTVQSLEYIKYSVDEDKASIAFKRRNGKLLAPGKDGRVIKESNKCKCSRRALVFQPLLHV